MSLIKGEFVATLTKAYLEIVLFDKHIYLTKLRLCARCNF